MPESIVHSPYYFFGSANSLDKDVLVECKSIPDKQTAQEWITVYKQTQGVDWNINLITIRDGIVVDTIPSKSTIDGVNNALFDTYSLHTQQHPLPITHKVRRHVLLNVYRCIRTILTFCTRTRYRSQIRPTLNGIHPFYHKLESLALINFTTLDTFDAKYTQDVDIWKTIPFYLGQTIALLDGIEIYTKDSLVAHFPQFSRFIYRQPFPTEDVQSLQQTKDAFVDTLTNLPFQNPESGVLILHDEKINMSLEMAL